MAGKTKFEFCTFLFLKGNISVRGGAFVFSPEATRGRIEQNITTTRFFKAIKYTKVHNV